MLEESDDGIIHYFPVTYLGKIGFWASRLGIATILTIPLNMLAPVLFHITVLQMSDAFFMSIVGAVQGYAVALMIVVLSSNNVEGTATGKLTSLLTIGLEVP